MHEKWSDREIKLLKQNYPKKSKEELMKMLPDRCADGIRMKAKRLGLKKSV